MRRPVSALSLLAAGLLLVPSAASAQIGVMPKVGSLGVGADVGIGLAPMLGLRAGFGLIPIEPEPEFEGNSYTLSLPNSFTVAADLNLGGGGFRVSGGLLVQSGDIEIDGTFTGSVEIGGTTYTDDVTVNGVLDRSAASPFVSIGYGKAYGAGVGLFVEGGVAFGGDPTLELTATGEATSLPGFQADLEAEEQDIQDEIDDSAFSSLWPILNIGIRIGL